MLSSSDSNLEKVLNILNLTKYCSTKVIILAIYSLVFLFNLNLINKTFASIFIVKIDEILKTSRIFLKTEFYNN